MMVLKEEMMGGSDAHGTFLIIRKVVVQVCLREWQSPQESGAGG